MAAQTVNEDRREAQSQQAEKRTSAARWHDITSSEKNASNKRQRVNAQVDDIMIIAVVSAYANMSQDAVIVITQRCRLSALCYAFVTITR